MREWGRGRRETERDRQNTQKTLQAVGRLKIGKPQKFDIVSLETKSIFTPCAAASSISSREQRVLAGALQWADEAGAGAASSDNPELCQAPVSCSVELKSQSSNSALNSSPQSIKRNPIKNPK